MSLKDLLKLHINKFTRYASFYWLTFVGEIQLASFFKSLQNNDVFCFHFFNCCFVCFFFLAERPGIVGIPKNHTVTFIEREDVKINCRTTGIPIPNVTWTRSGNEAKNFPPASPLILKNISREEDGLYWCVAENGLGKVTASVRVIVKCKYYWKQ